MSIPTALPLRPLLISAALLLSACAQNPVQPDPNEGRASTQQDALRQAQGADTTRAHSQINLGFGQERGEPRTETQAEAVRAVPAAGLPELAEPKTFLGTLSCPPQAGQCKPSKISLTLAPAGQWRMRAEEVGGTAAPRLSAGCWAIIGTQPSRIALLQNDTTMADLSFLSGNVMRINTFNQVRPTLESRLTRQADIDAIGELDGKPAPACP